MSKQRLTEFLQKIEAELSAPGGSEAFRKYKANKRVHTFNYRASTIEKTMTRLLDSATSIEGSGTKIISGIRKEFDAELDKLTSNIMKAVARDAARSSREAELNRKRLIKEQEAQRKAAERQRKQAEIEAKRSLAQTEKEKKQLEKEAKLQYITSRMEEAEELNENDSSDQL